MWGTVWGWLKTLVGGWKGSSQIGSRNRSASGVRVGDNASVVAVGQDIRIIQQPGATKEPPTPVAILEKQIPALINEMRAHLASNPTAREFILSERAWVYNSDPNRNVLVYYFDDHPGLRNKMRLLEHYGLIRDIKFNNVDRFVLEEGFVAYLTGVAED